MHPLLDEMQEALRAAGSDPGEERPKLMLDGRKVDPAAEQGPIRGTAAMLASTNAKTFPQVASRLDVERLLVIEFRGDDLSALASCKRLTHLSLNWATKLADISPLKDLSELRFLEFRDTPKVQDLSPLGALENLRVLTFEGGMDTKNKAQSLEPLAALSRLEVLVLTDLSVTDGGLRPLAALTGLDALFLSNQFETADYAYLSVHLPDTDCAEFAAYQKINSPKGYADIMVTGKRKPFLKSWEDKDRKRLEKYVSDFEALQEGFRSERG